MNEQQKQKKKKPEETICHKNTFRQFAYKIKFKFLLPYQRSQIDRPNEQLLPLQGNAII